MAAATTELRIVTGLASPRKTLFSVRDRNGAYQTTTVHGQRASSTAGYETAARALANKLHPHQAWQLKLVSAEQGTQVFELQALTNDQLNARDAARYRWMRAAWLEGIEDDTDPVAQQAIGKVQDEDEMDAVIDAQIAAGNWPVRR